MSARAGIRTVRCLFTVIGLVALGYCAVVWVGARLYQMREAHRFTMKAHVPTIPAAPDEAPPTQAAPPQGEVVGRLVIPRIHLSVMVVEGVGDRDLRYAVGHIPGTALPGESGTVGLAGHRDTFFRPLRAIHCGDTITLSTLKELYLYRVVSTSVVSPNDVQVLYPTGRETLTLVTCFPFDYIGSAPRRFIVRADRLPGV